MEHRSPEEDLWNVLRRTLLAGCFLGILVLSERPVSSATAATIPAVPRPDLSTLTSPAQRSIASAQATLQQEIDQGKVPSEQLAPGFGFLGQLFRAYELFTAAESCYSAAHELQPRNGEWLYLRALTRQEQGRIDDAVEDLRAVTTLQPDLIPARLQLGELLLGLQRPGEARQEFAAVLARESQNGAAEYGLGRADLAFGDAAAAIDHLEMALSLQPSATVVHGPLEEAYRSLGQAERADQHRGKRGDDEFPVVDPWNDAILRLQTVTDFMVVQEMARSTSFQEADFLALVLDRIAAMPGAIDQMSSVLKEMGAVGTPVAQGRIQYARAALLLHAGREDEALEDLGAAIQLAPTLLDARLQLGNGLARRGRFEDAIFEYDRLLSLSADYPEALLKRAAARANIGEMSGARLDLEHALEIAREPETTAEARTLLAGLDLAQQNFGVAEENYRAAIAAEPDSVKALSGLASLLGRLGRYREAAVFFRAVIGLEPDNGSARLGEAIALLLVEDYAGARARLVEGVAELPSDMALEGKLALLLAACPDHSQRDGARAVKHAKHLFAKRPDMESAEVLAMAHAEAGDFEQAIAWQKRLLTSGDTPPEAGQRAVWERNLARYENGLSCCAGSGERMSRGEEE